MTVEWETSDFWLPWKWPLTSLLFFLRPMYVDYAVNDSARVDGLKPVAMLLRQSLEPLLKVTYHATYKEFSLICKSARSWYWQYLLWSLHTSESQCWPRFVGPWALLPENVSLLPGTMWQCLHRSCHCWYRRTISGTWRCLRVSHK